MREQGGGLWLRWKSYVHSVLKKKSKHVPMRENLHDRGISTVSATALCSQTAAFRYEKLAEQEEMSAQQQRRKLFAELQLERDKMAAQWEQQRRELEQQQADSQVRPKSQAVHIPSRHPLVPLGWTHSRIGRGVQGALQSYGGS